MPEKCFETTWPAQTALRHYIAHYIILCIIKRFWTQKNSLKTKFVLYATHMLPEKCFETTWPAQSWALLREHHCFKAVVNLPFALTQQLERKFSGHFLKYQVHVTILKSSHTNLIQLWFFSSNYCIHANYSLSLLPFDDKILVWISYLVVRSSSCLRVRLVCLLLPATGRRL